MIDLATPLLIASLLMVGCAKSISLEASDTPMSAYRVMAERTGRPLQADVTEVNHDLTLLTVSGFIPRWQISNLGEPVVLWEDDAQLPYFVTEDLLYQGEALYRPEDTELTYHVAFDVLHIPEFREAFPRAIATIEAQTPYMLTPALDPSDAQIEFIRAATFGVIATAPYVTHARIFVGNPSGYPGQHYQRAITHELGHVFGLRDCHLGRGMMCAQAPVLNFSGQEVELIRKARTRRAGNTAPDDELPKAWAQSAQEFQACSFGSL